MRLMMARLLVVLSAALCLWIVTPGSASASDCGGGFRVGAASSDPDDGLHRCNGYAGNAARVLGGTAAAVAIGLGVLAYRRGARAVRTSFEAADQRPAGGPPASGDQPLAGPSLGEPSLREPAPGDPP
jgi:hypothetical protein